MQGRTNDHNFIDPVNSTLNRGTSFVAALKRVGILSKRRVDLFDIAVAVAVGAGNRALMVDLYEACPEFIEGAWGFWRVKSYDALRFLCDV